MGQGLPPGPLCHSHFLFLARIIGITCLGHIDMALEFFLVQIRVLVFIRRELLHHVCQRGKFQLKSQILDRLSESQNCQINRFLFYYAWREAPVLDLSEALHVL